jgi:hypothetical protein
MYPLRTDASENKSHVWIDSEVSGAQVNIIILSFDE